MKLGIFSAILYLSGMLSIGCTPISENGDTQNLLIRPCGDHEANTMTMGFFLALQSEEIGTRDMLTDVIIYMREASHQIEILMGRYREESGSSRYTLMLEHRRDVGRVNAESETSSVFRAFSENLRLDYDETSKAWLYLNNFRSVTSATLKIIVDRLKEKTTQLLCRFSELVDGEGEELSPPVSNPPLYGHTDDEYTMIVNEYGILREMKDYLEQKVSLYRYYERHVMSN